MVIKIGVFVKIIRVNRKGSNFLMLFFRIVQVKITDFYDCRLNSIGVNPYFFRLFLRKWCQMNQLTKVD